MALLEKYFGFLSVHDEYSVIESLIEHAKVDDEELFIMQKMIELLPSSPNQAIEDEYQKIRNMSKDSARVFESISDQVIQANFDHQKQYDLLRLHQRIDSISGLIIATAKRAVIFHRIGGKLPEELSDKLNELSQAQIDIHATFKEALNSYLECKQEVINKIHKITEQENHIDHIRSEGLEILYRLGNTGSVPMGSFMALQEIIQHLEEISDAIESAATSLDWLLLQ